MTPRYASEEPVSRARKGMAGPREPTQAPTPMLPMNAAKDIYGMGKYGSSGSSGRVVVVLVLFTS
jgi:hypothetical protein